MTRVQAAVVLLSGGVDSATVLALARAAGFACHALTIDYGQRHRVELQAAARVAKALRAVEHRIVSIDLRAVGGSALTAEIDVPKDRPAAQHEALGLQSQGFNHDIPITYVPARNTIFLSIALGYAEVINAADLFIGANAVDYSGYPDCRPAFIEAFEKLANVATKAGAEGRPFHVHAPLIQMTKGQIIRTGVDLGVDYSLTWSCYDPRPRPRISGTDGPLPCGRCDSCLIRAAGFHAAGIDDPASSAAP